MEENQKIAIKEFSVNTLEEFYETTNMIATCYSAPQNVSEKPPLWFRGSEKSSYNLLPTIYRTYKNMELNDSGTYSNIHLGEDYRYQNFKSKVNLHVSTCPSSKMEWQEIMQHHNSNTRLLDWTESATIALIFALEKFLIPSRELNAKRRTLSPTVWVLVPSKTNRILFETMTAQDGMGNYPYIYDAIDDILPENVSSFDRRKLSTEIGKELSAHKGLYFYDEKVSRPAINGIPSLSAIDSLRCENISRLYKMICNFEFNPFFYLLARYYSDGIVIPSERLTPSKMLPPLAVVHPYHSERMQAQHGVFTVFPYYDSQDHDLSYAGIDIRSLDFQPSLRKFLFKVRLTNACYIAKQLISNGERRTSIYPELPKYTDDIEAQRYFV